MRVCDLFAGIGGFTCGALEAGANVLLAVDSDPVPLKLLGANAPQTTTVVATLGTEAVDLPPAAPDLHVHMSTPCTTLSMARRGKTTAASNDGLQMIRWAVQFVLERGDHSWSLENVATKATRALFSELEAAYPEKVAWGTFDSADFGAPQSRVRLIAGPQKLIKMLQGTPCSRRVSIRDAFAERGEVTPANYCKNQTRSHGGDPTTRTVETTSFTVCASRALTWCHIDGKSVRVMTARDSSVLMGFPPLWRLPKGSRASQRAVGNAVCVALSKAITLAAIAVLNGDAAVVTPMPQATKKRAIADVSREEYDTLRQRVDELEESVPHLSNIIDD
jgi:site-specific DNA-cytosine methylase